MAGGWVKGRLPPFCAKNQSIKWLGHCLIWQSIVVIYLWFI